MKRMMGQWSLALLIAACVVLVASEPTFAGTPKKISYQGRATDASDNPVTDGDHSFVFSLYDHPTTGAQRWTESATVGTVDGLFTHLLGSIVPLPDSLFANYDSLYLQVSIDGQTLLPRSPVVSSGYALRVNAVDGALGGKIFGQVSLKDMVFEESKISLYAEPGGTGSIGLARGDGFWGLSMSGSPWLAMWGDSGTAVFQPNKSGSASVQLPYRAIEASETLDEPGVGSDNNFDISLTGSPQFLAGRTMMAPVDGYVLVIATAHAIIQHTSGTQSTCIFSVSDNISSYVSSTISRITLPSTLPTGLYEFPIGSQAVFPIVAGSQAYYALGGKAGATSVTVYDVQLSECFFATAYTTVSEPAPPLGSTVESSASFDPAAESLEAQAFHNARIQAELDRMKTELEAVRQEMNDLKSSGEFQH